MHIDEIMQRIHNERLYEEYKKKKKKKTYGKSKEIWIFLVFVADGALVAFDDNHIGIQLLLKTMNIVRKVTMRYEK
jgi:uncharacterized membrane protein (DUF485 family)